MKSTKSLLVALAMVVVGGAACQQTAGGKLKTVYFDFDRYDIKAEYQGALKSNAAWAQSNANKKLEVQGHCDERGSTEYNIALGDRRAKAAKAYLQHLGVNGSKVNTVSFGEERPACSDHNEGCWAKNRRAEFVGK